MSSVSDSPSQSPPKLRTIFSAGTANISAKQKTPRLPPTRSSRPSTGKEQAPTPTTYFQGRSTQYPIQTPAPSTQILKSCQRCLADLPPGLSLLEMKKAYRIWNESTSTSTSGRHLGHYHAILKVDGLKSNSAEALVTAASRNSIWTIHHSLLYYGIRNAHCFSRWKQIVNAMIEKEPGNPAIHRLRVIHLYENDYNLLLGTHYRKAVQAAEDSDVLNDGNFGARTARSSLDPIGIEILQYE
jgi:hypothetical protein